MTEFKLLTFEFRGLLSVGMLIGDNIFPLEKAYDFFSEQTGKKPLPAPAQPWTMLYLLENSPLFFELCSALAEFYAARAQDPEVSRFIFHPAELNIKAPILYPQKVLNAGANYYDHNLEMGVPAFDKAQAQPFFFYKGMKNCIIGHKEPIRLPRVAKYIDWEAELAVVIGKRCKDVSAKDARSYVAGYTILNDISARDKMIREGQLFFFDWFANKGNDTFAPTGPYIVPAAFIPDPHNLRIRCLLNGQVMQDSSTSKMIWSVDEIIEYVSTVVTLEPGDIIATGSPGGVGMAKGLSLKPGEFKKLFDHMYSGGGMFLKSGDTLISEIEKIGSLENPVI